MEDVMVNVHGQTRIIEAVIASIIIVIVFTAAFFMLLSSENIFRQETVDLNKLAYNTLHRLADSGALETIKEDASRTKEMLVEMLPQGIYFNLTVERAPPNSGVIRTVANAAPGEFEKPREIASTNLLYTTRTGEIYLVTLRLTRAGL